MVFVRKASDIKYTDISNVYDISALYKKYKEFVINENPWKNHDIEAVARCWNVSIEKAKQISNCDFQLLISDDWIE